MIGGLVLHQSLFLKRIQKVASAAFIIGIASSAVGLLTSALLARWLGPLRFGVYSYVVSLTGMAGVVSSLGFPTLLLRQTALAKATSNWGPAKGVLIHGARVTFLTSVCMGFIVWVIANHFARFRGMANFHADVVLAIIAMICSAIAGLVASALQGLDRIIASIVPGSLIGPIGLLLAMVLVQFINGRLGVTVILLCQAVIALFLVVFQVAQFGRFAPMELLRSSYQVRFPGWIVSAMPFLLNSLMIVVNLRTDIFLLATLRGPEMAGVYTAATRGAMLLVLPLGALATAARPTMAKLYAQGDAIRLQALISMTSRVSALIALLGCGLLVLLGKNLLILAFGSAYASGASALGILSMFRVINASTGSLGPFLSMTERQRALVIGLALEALANISFNYLLIPRFGMDGSALATGGSMALSNIVLSVWVYRTSGHDMSVLGLATHYSREKEASDNALGERRPTHL